MILSTGILLAGLLAALAQVSFAASPRVRSADAFFLGVSNTSQAPGMWTLVLSQVTTWIFARSLLNAAILGYAFGIAGVIGYTAYYLSFVSGALIVDRIRFRDGFTNIQSFMRAEYGRFGVVSYNFLVAVRLVSELFANLLVVGILFGAAGSNAYYLAIAFVAGATLIYSMMGGLQASLRTDVVQMLIFLSVLVVLLAVVLSGPALDLPRMIYNPAVNSSPGWILVAVALLQIISYPMHDPVMMDRGFLAGRSVTWRSFFLAFWLSALCIFAFGMIGVHAGLHKIAGEAFMPTLQRILNQPAFILVNLALLVSAMSTLDSALASASKLAIADMGLARRNLRNGRIAMALFMAAGLIMLAFGSKDLFSAVAVSGTAAMFLAPVIVFRILANRQVAPWAYSTAFTLAIAGAAIYFLDTSGHTQIVAGLLGPVHKYTMLLLLNLVILAGGLAAFALGVRRKPA